LADRGQIDEAERHLAAHLTLCPKSIEGLLLSGQFALHRGEPDRAVQALRSLLFLAPEHHLGRYWYVVALEHAGDSRAASEQRRELQRTLTSRSDRATPPSEELEEAIREMIRGAHGDKT
jgi:predicted Zn-dependent protease